MAFGFHAPPESPAGRLELTNFFDRLASGDYDGLAAEHKRFGSPIIPRRVCVSTPAPPPAPPITPAPAKPIPPPQPEPQRARPSADMVKRALALLGGASPACTEEEFQFTFKLMIHDLYDVEEFKRMIAEVVRTSQERFQPLPPELVATPRRNERRGSVDSSCYTDSPGPIAFPSLTSGSSAGTTSEWSASLDGDGEAEEEEEEDYLRLQKGKTMKRRCVGRKMSMAGLDGEGEEVWAYDAVDTPEPARTSFALPGPPPPTPATPGYRWPAVAEAGDVGVLPLTAGRGTTHETPQRKRRLSYY